MRVRRVISGAERQQTSASQLSRRAAIASCTSLKMIFQEQHASDDDIRTANISAASGQRSLITREFVCGMQSQFKARDLLAQ